ncbi:MAG: hypothetical protein K8F56_16835, partial [Rhodocyclaceae bacterium]|nr:hypothetical protein [Rhodocyclaceae bacterium]
LNFAIETGFVLIGLAMTLNLWRLVRGPDATDRILALDTMTINAIALLVAAGPLLALFARPVADYTARAAAQLHAPKAYIAAVLGKDTRSIWRQRRP